MKPSGEWKAVRIDGKPKSGGKCKSPARIDFETFKTQGNEKGVPISFGVSKAQDFPKEGTHFLNRNGV